MIADQMKVLRRPVGGPSRRGTDHENREHESGTPHSHETSCAPGSREEK
jgi:hypothetical protein